MLRTILLSITLAACAKGPFDDEPGGSDHLPTRGAGPFTKLDVNFDTPGDEPFLLYDQGAHFSDPMGVWRQDGGLIIWFTRQQLDSDEATIEVAELPSVTDLPDVQPRLALSASADWEQGFVAEPNIINHGSGDLVMFYRGGTDNPAIGRADSDDGGRTWTKHADNPVLVDAFHPAAAELANETLLYFELLDREGIFVASSTDGIDFELEDQPVIEKRDSTFEAFDLRRVSDPFAVVTRLRDNETDRHIGLFYVGRSPGHDNEMIESIGYAGSFDGRHFERFLSPEPVLSRTRPSEGGPSVVLRSDSAILLFHEPKQNRLRIAAAVHP